MNKLALALFAALAVTGCRQSDDAPVAAQSPEARSPDALPPEAKPGLGVEGAMLVLPAVAGNPAAIYFTLNNTGAAPARLAAISVEGAGSTEMHETKGGTMSAVNGVDVPANGSAAFARGGLHVMVFGLPGNTLPGAELEMTLTFADGDKLSVPVKAVGAGAAGSGAMDHGNKH